MVEGLMAEHDVDARIGERNARAVRVMQLDRRSATMRFLRCMRERVGVAIDPDDFPGRERFAQQTERLALTAAGIEDHRRGRRRRRDQLLQIVDGDPEHMVLPGMRAKKPDAEAGFGNIGGSVRAVGRHGLSLECWIC